MRGDVADYPLFHSGQPPPAAPRVGTGIRRIVVDEAKKRKISREA